MSRNDVTIFVVDDDDVSQMFVSRALEEIGSRSKVIAAVDGVEALEILRAADSARRLNRPFITLLDLRMPRMDGLEFLTEIRRDSQLHDLIVFMLTTSKQPHDIAKAFEHNIAGYLVKPDSYDVFKDMISMVESYCNVNTWPVPDKDVALAARARAMLNKPVPPKTAELRTGMHN